LAWLFFLNSFDGLKISGTGPGTGDSCWDISHRCSCWWCGGNWKCATIRSRRLSSHTLHLWFNISINQLCFLTKRMCP